MTKIKHLFIVLTLSVLTLSAKSQDLNTDLQNLFADTIGSSNMVYAPFFARKLTGNADEAGLLGFYNFNNNVAAGIGIAHLWQPSGGQASSTFTLSVGLSLRADIYPLKVFGLTNFAVEPFGITAVGTPVNGENHGNLMNANRIGAAVQIYKFNAGKNIITFNAGAFYGNQTGTGYFDGNYAGGFTAGGWSSADGSILKTAGLDQFEESGGMVALTGNVSF